MFNPVKVIRQARIKREQQIRIDTINYLAANGLLKSNVS